MDRFERYVDDVEAHFGPHSDHPAVGLARRLTGERGVSWDAPMGLAVHVTDPPALAARMPFDASISEASTLDPRWPPGNARAFVELARAFARDADFERFFREHRALYDTAEARMRALLGRHVDAAWFEAFFGARPDARFTVLIGLSNGGASYAVRFAAPGRPEELYAVMGTWLTDDEGLPRYDESVTGTVVHEFAHAYVNPLVDALRPAGEALLDAARGPMTRQGYGAGPIVVEESVVRAAVARYALAHGGPEAGRREVAAQGELGFVWADDLYALLGAYDHARDRYPTFSAFFPTVGAYLRDLAPRAEHEVARYEARRPRLLSMAPANGAVGVDPGLSEMTFRFDRPMERVWALMLLGEDGREHFPPTGEPSFDDSGTVLTVPVTLEPNRTYRLGLNFEGGGAFRSTEGVRLAPVPVEFSTGDADGP